jgi:hypothetical protein
MKNWDLFISHASEDKEDVAMPLAEVLQRAGLRVWIDRQQIELGDSIRERIDNGLAESRFGVVILSPAFLQKIWPQRELGALMSIEDAGHKVLLPIWHQVSKADVARVSPLLADRAAAETTLGIAVVASKIMKVVLNEASSSPSTLFPSVTRRLVELIEADDRRSLANFLMSQVQLLRAMHVWAENVSLQSDDPPVLAASMWFPSIDIQSVSFVAFASTHAIPFRGDIAATELVETCLRLIREGLSNVKKLDPGADHNMSVVLCGRRELMNDADRERRREHTMRLQEEKISIRSYDWLLDASLIAHK